FDVTLVLAGRRFQVLLPVVSPAFKETTEIIPEAELKERLVQAELINQELAQRAQLPDDVKVAMPDFTISAINFVPVGEGEEEDRKTVPITGLLVIPGKIGFLNQFFSVQIFTENAAPEGSGLSVEQVIATIHLPPGRNTNDPGDDPLRLARVGPNRTP